MRLIFKVLPFLLCFALPLVSEARPHMGYTCEKAGVTPVGPSCFQVACDLIGGPRFCSSSEEISNVNQACNNNIDGRCLQNTCQILGIRTCKGLEEVQAVAASCQGVCDTSCTNVACGFYGCSNTAKSSDVNLACSGVVSGECVRNACTSSRCSSLEGLREATRSCGSVM